MTGLQIAVLVIAGWLLVVTGIVLFFRAVGRGIRRADEEAQRRFRRGGGAGHPRAA